MVGLGNGVGFIRGSRRPDPMELKQPPQLEQCGRADRRLLGQPHRGADARVKHPCRHAASRAARKSNVYDFPLTRR